MSFPAFVLAQQSELEDARKHHKPMNSLHEAFAVIYEEVDELWDEVRKKPRKRDRTAIYKELVQIATMCQRAAEDLGLTTEDRDNV